MLSFINLKMDQITDKNLVNGLKCAATFIKYTMGFEDNAKNNIKCLISKFYTG